MLVDKLVNHMFSQKVMYLPQKKNYGVLKEMF
jgi:hypothetical protein